MALTGRNLNVISLAGLSFAVGMVVDKAIASQRSIFGRNAGGSNSIEVEVVGTDLAAGTVGTWPR